MSDSVDRNQDRDAQLDAQLDEALKADVEQSDESEPFTERLDIGQGTVTPTPAERTCSRCKAVVTVEGGRCPFCGAVLKGNLVALKTGATSRQVREALLPEQRAALDALAESVAEIELHLGGADQISVMQRRLARRLVELETIADHLWREMEGKGILTSKGHARAALSGYLSAVDRVLKLADKLGLERRQKAVDPMEELRLAVVEANKQADAERQARQQQPEVHER